MNVWGDFATVFAMAAAVSFGFFTGLFFFVAFMEWWREHQ